MGSCNGCRVLRKGCNDNCTIRPCLQWIQRSDAQSNATMFLAKFYGRAGLINLLDSGPEPFRPALFRSLLYEACGRIVNPVYGSVGLMCTGQWQLCEAAVQSVLNGIPIFAMPSLRAYDIRHVPKSKELAGPSTQLHSVKKNGAAPFKRSGHQAAACSVANSTIETEETVSQDEYEEVDGAGLGLGLGLGLDLNLSLSLAPLGTASRAHAG